MITYHDSIADSDCIILVAKNENLILPENEYDERLDESSTPYPKFLCKFLRIFFQGCMSKSIGVAGYAEAF